MKPAMPPRMDSLSLVTRITMGTLLLFLLVTLVQVYLISTKERTQYLAELQNRLVARVDFRSMELQTGIDELRRDALFVSNTPPVQGILRATGNRGLDPLEHDSMDVWKKQLAEIFIAFLNANPDYYQVRYIGLADGGRELVRIDRVGDHPVVTPQDELQQKADRDYFQAALQRKHGEAYLSEINLNREHGRVETPHRRTLRAVVPVYSPEAKPFGMIAINMDMGPVLDRLAGGMPKGLRVYLMNSEGDYLVHPEQSRTFGFDLGRRFRWQDDARATQAADKDAAPAGLQAFLLSGELMHGKLRELHFDPQQPQRFVMLAYAMPDAAIDDHAAVTRNAAITGTLGVTVFIGLLLFLYVRRTLKPLVQLTDAAHAIGAGRHDTPLPKHAGGEIGTFVQAFEGMLDGIWQREQHIRKLNLELEQRVQARTAELQRLTESMREALAMLDASRDGAFIFDPETLRFSYVNEGAVQQVGYSREELLRMTPVDIKPEIDEQQFRSMIAPMLRDDQHTFRFETIHRHKDGHDVPVEINLQFVPSVGVRGKLIAIVRDITERRQAEEEQKQLTAQLAISNQELERFAYVASHDLQEPLRTVASYLQLVERRYADKLDDDGREFIHYAVDGASRMQRLIKDLLEFSRVQTQGRPFVPVDLNSVLANVLADLKTAIDENTATVTHDPLPSVMGDEGQLRRLLQNLIGNGLKYRREEAPCIHLAARRIEDSPIKRPGTAPAKGWLISVQDNGIGIEPQYHEKIFNLFQRLHTRKDFPGTGLGLALCKRIVERHDGSIWVESSRGEGSVFYVALPISN